MRRRVAIVGGGHNALTAAAYLARADVEVTLLERSGHFGGAAISSRVFPGLDANLSRYAYLVGLLPTTIASDLTLNVRLVRRRYASYTPQPGTPRGLLIDTHDPRATASSFATIGAAADIAGFETFYARTSRLARALWPTLTAPLPTRTQARSLLGSDWDDFVERPIGEAIEAAVANDLVRGIIATDALIGTLADPRETSLRQNRCLLYHVIGGGTGHWDVPVQGMGTITAQLIDSARRAGAKLLAGAEVIAITPDGEVTWVCGDAESSDGFDLVLMGAAPSHLDRLCGSGRQNNQAQGAQVKANLLLTRLPKLRDARVSAEAAFGGTFHVNEGYGRLAAAHQEASVGRVPHPLPCEIYCHSLADPTILGADLRERGWHTLTVFGLQVPDALVDTIGNDALRARLTTAVLGSLDSVLGEPIEPLLALDGDGAPCLEVKTTRDLEDALAMPRGQIFHGSLSWPWADADDPLDTPARRWGVATDHPRILICGAGARRGGGVSGIGGHNAAMAALESLRP